MKHLLNQKLKNLRQLLMVLSLVCFASISKAADYYWVGGTGLWTDLTHWATTSGGTVNPTIVPTPIDNVIIDNNSFSASGGTITINFEAFCNNFTVTGTRSANIIFAFNSGLNASNLITVAAGPTLTWNQSVKLTSRYGVVFNNVNFNVVTHATLIEVYKNNLNLSTNTIYNGGGASHNCILDTGTLVLDGTSRFTQTNGTFTSGFGDLIVPSGAFFTNTTATKNVKNGTFIGQAGSNISVSGPWNIYDGGYDVSRLATYIKSSGDVNFYATRFGQYNIRGGGKDMHRIYLQGTNYNAEYRMQDSLAVMNDGIFPYVNKFITNGYRLKVSRFYCWSGNPVSIDFTGTDTIYTDYEFRIYPSNVTFNAGTATIKMVSTNHIQFIGGGKVFNDVVINAQNTGGTQVYFEYNNTFRDITINANGQQYLDFSGANVVRNFSFNHLQNTTTFYAPRLRFYSTNAFRGTFKTTSFSTTIRPIIDFQSNDSIGVFDINNISEWVVTSGRTINVTNFVPLLGTCQRTILIHSSNGGSRFFLRQLTDTVKCDWAQIQDVGASGGAYFMATNSIDLGNNSGWNISTIAPQNFYWIGRNGNWSDAANWSLSSGGTAGCAIPSRIDNVFFDANSFTAANQYCNVNVTAECKSMTWSGIVTNSGLSGSQALHIFGSLTLASNMNMAYNGNMYFQSTTIGNTITTAGKVLNCPIYFQGQNQNSGVWTMQDSLRTTNWVYFYYGTFKSNGFNLDIYATQATNSSTVDFTGGTTRVKIGYYWYVNSGVVLKMGTADLLIQNNNNYIYFYTYGNSSANYKQYNTVTLDMQTTSNYQIRLEGNYNRIRNLYANHNGDGTVYDWMYLDSIDNYSINFYRNFVSQNGLAYLYGQAYQRVLPNLNINGTGSNTPRAEIYYFNPLRTKKFTANNLSMLRFVAGYTFLVDTLIINGTCNRRTVVNSMSTGTQASITSAYVSADYAAISDIRIIGSGSYTATNSVNLGNVTNWPFTNAGTNFYWIAGTGNWYEGTHWSFSSGGAASGCVPGPGDNVFFDVNSFTAANQTVTLDRDAFCNNMLWNNVNNPRFSGNYNLNVYGSMQLAPNLSWLQNAYVYFQSRQNGNTINTNGVKLYYVMFNGDGSYLGEWTLQNNLEALVYAYFRSGKFVSNGYQLKARSLYNDYNDNRITLNFTGTDTVFLDYELRFSSNCTILASGTNFKFTSLSNGFNRIYGGGKTFRDLVFDNVTATTATNEINDNNTFRNIIFNSTRYPIINVAGSNTFNDVSFTFNNSTTNIPTITFSSSNTFNNLTVTSTGNGGPYLYLNQSNTFNSLIAAGLGTRLLLGAGRTQTVNSLLALGNGSYPVIVRSQTSGTLATIYKPSGRVCLDFVLMQDVKADALPNGSGGLQTAFFAGASSVNLGNNPNWSFSSCNAFYWVGDNGNWSDYANHWATSSGGTNFQTTVPGPNDDVFFDANSFTTTGRTVTVDVPVATTRDMKWGSAVFTPTFTGSGEIRIYGDLELISAMNQNYSGDWNFMANDNGHTINSAGKTMYNASFIGGNSGQGAWTLLNPLNVTNDLNFNNGTLITGGKDITTKNFNSTTSNLRSLQLGVSTVTIKNGSWNPSTLTNATLQEGTSTLVVTGTGGTASFFGNSLIYNNVTFTTTTTLGATLTGANTFNTLRVDKGLTLSVEPGIQTMSQFIADGTCGTMININSTNPGTQATFSKTSGTVNATFLNLTDMKAQGGATWNANYSNNVSNNTGWNFTPPPTFTYNVSATNATCAAGNNGTASVTSLSGGVTPYTYLWSTTETTSSISNLIPGNYSVTVKDAAGCSVTQNFSIIITPGYITPTPFSASATDVCLGTTINFTAGTPPEGVASYLWNFGDFNTVTTQNPSKTYTTAGTYTVSLSYIDTNGCPTVVTKTIRVSSVSQSVSSSNVNCFGAADGSISITSSGGIAPLLYSINNGVNYFSTSNFTGLAPATYQVKTKDSIGCTSATAAISVTQPAATLSAGISKVNVSCAANNDGSISISASGGTAPYSYSINGGILFLGSNTFSNLTAGTYNVVVRDSRNCLTTSQSVVIGVTDNVLPTITCPTNIATTPTSGCIAAVVVPTPSAGDNCGVASILNNFNGTGDASGNYPLGVTTVVWTVTDVNNNIRTCSMTVTVNTPEINVVGNANNITDGSTSPSLSNHTDFGNYTGSTITRTYTVQNNGSSTLTLNTITLSGANAGDFSIPSISFPVAISAGTSFSFNVNFAASGSGFRTATVNIANSDCDEGTYDFAIQGSGCPTLSAGNSGPVCVLNALSLSASNGFTSYTWTGPNGFGSTQQNPILGASAVTTLAAGTYTVTANISGACSTSASTNVIVHALPGVAVTPFAASICQGASVTINASSSAGLVGYYRFDETSGTTVTDISGNNLTGTFVNAPTRVSSTAPITGGGNALTLNHPNYVNVPDNAAFNTMQSKFTIEAWVYQTDNTNNTIVDRANYNFLFEVMPNGQPGLGFYNPNGGWSYSTTGIPVNQWVHVAVSWDASTGTLRFYKNGVQTDVFSRGTLYFNSGPMNIGRQEPNGCQCNIFTGTIDELRLWNVTRTQAEIAGAMNVTISPVVATSFTWSPSTGLNTPTGATVIATPTVSTQYSVTGTSAQGCSKTDNYSLITVINPPTASASNLGPYCVRDTIKLFSGDPGNSYSWTGPNGFTSTQQNPVILNATAAMAGTYTVTVTNANNCTNTATTNVVVNALPTPTASSNSPVCAGSTLNLSANGGAAYFWTGPNGFTDNSTATPSISNVTSAAAGHYVVKVQDTNGCRDTASTDVVIYPAPVFTLCPSNQSATATTGMCNATVTYTATATGIPDPTLTYSFSGATTGSGSGTGSGASFNIGTTTVTITATNTCGSVNCVFTVTISAPEINVKGNSTSITQNDFTPSSSDHTDFGGTLPSTSIVRTFTIENNGTSTLNISAMAMNGGSPANFTIGGISLPASIAVNGSTTFTVTFSGTTPGMYPAIVNITSNDCDENPYAFGVTAEVTCTVPAFTSCPSNMNANTSSSTCNAAVTYSATATGIPTPAFTYTFTGATTGSGSGTGSGATFNKGVTTVTITATNSCGSTNCVFTVTVNDNQKPVISCPANITVYSSAASCGAIATYSANVTDNCGVASTIYSPISGSVFSLGTTNVTVTATDVNGNVETCTFTVTVRDTIKPVIGSGSSLTAPPSLALINVPEAAGYSVVYQMDIANSSDFSNNPVPYTVNNSAATGVNYNRVAYFMQLDNKWVWVSMDKFTSNLVQLGIPNAAHNNVEWQRTISNMNVYSSAGSGVTNGTGISTGNLEMWHHCYATGAELGGIGGNGGNYDFNDNNGVQNPSCYGSFQVHNYGIDQTLFAYNRWDAGGNSDLGIGNQPSSHPDWTFAQNAAIYTVKKLYILVDATQCQTVTVNTANGQCTGVATYSPIATDNCGTPTVTTSIPSGSTFNVGSTPVTVNATDASGNLSTCTFNVVVVDNQKPVITCPANISVNAPIGTCAANVNFAADATDNCAVANVTYSPASGSSFAVGTTTVKVIATDVNGNKDSCTFTVTVNDIQRPVITCPSNITVNAGTGLCNASVTIQQPSATDNCSGQITILGNGISFDGSNDYISTGVALGSNSTIEFWIKPNNTNYDTRIISDASGNTSGFGLMFSSGKIQVWNSCATWQDITSSTIPTTQWTHIAVVKNGSQITGFVNGVQQLTVTCGHQMTNLAIGAPFLFTYGNYYSGLMDEVRFWSVSRTGSQIQANMGIEIAPQSGLLRYYKFNQGVAGGNNGGLTSVTDHSGNGGNATLTNFALNGSTSNWVGGANSVENNVTFVNDYNNTANASGTYPVGTTTVRWIATDAAGNPDTCYQTVTVTDNQNPTITCPANITVNADAGNCTAIVASLGTPTTADNCGVASVSNNHPSATYPVGTTTVTWTVTDVNGRTATCNQTVTVTDNQNPTITCPSAITVNSETGNCSAVIASLGTPATADNCGVASVSNNHPSTTYPVGTTTVIWTVTDVNGRTATCNQTITVVDAERPVITCPSNITVNNATGQCNANVTVPQPTAIDNCSSATSTLGNALNFDGTNDFVTAVVNVSETAYTAEMWFKTSSGNGGLYAVNEGILGGACDRHIYLSGGNIYVRTWSNETIGTSGTNYADGNWHHVAHVVGTGGQKIYVDGVLKASGSKASSDFNWQDRIHVGFSNDGGYFNGTIDEVRVWSVARTQSQIQANMNGEILPQAGLQVYYKFNQGMASGNNAGLTTTTDASGNSYSGTLTNMALSGTTSNWVGGAGVTSNSPITFINNFNNTANASGTYPVGTTTVRWIATDAAGNPDTCYQTVTVTDNQNPTITCPANITVNADAGNCTAIVASLGTPTTADNCGVASVSNNHPSATYPVGTTTVTWTVTDVNGRTAACNQTVTVIDNQNPVLSCKVDTVLLDSAGTASISNANVVVSTSDNCAVASTTLSVYNFNVSNIGDNQVVVTTTDVNGNISRCTTNVYVVEPIPHAICKNATVYLNASGNGSITVDDVDNGSYSLVGLTSRVVSQSNFNCSHVGDNYVWLTVTNRFGKSDSCQATVTVRDTIDPVVLINDTIYVALDSNDFVSVTPAQFDMGSNDACGIDTIYTTPASFNCSNIGFNHITYTVVDNNGNTSTADAWVYVNSYFTLSYSTDTMDECSPVTIKWKGGCSGWGLDLSLISIDRWAVEKIVASNITNSGTYSWQIPPSVPAGNYLFYIQEHNQLNWHYGPGFYIRNTPANAIAQDLTIYLNASGSASITALQVDNGSNDICGIDTLLLSKYDFSCSNVGNNQVVLTAVDLNGNYSYDTATITVRDTIKPEVSCPANITAYSGAAECGTNVNFAADATDNCAVATVIYSPASGSFFNIGTTPVLVTVTDVNGNVQTCTFTVTVEDTIKPIVTTQNVTVYLDASGNGSTTVSAINNGSSDACGIQSMSLSQTAFTCAHVGSNTVTLTVTDNNGNVNTGTVSVSVVDTIRPTVVAQNVTVYLDVNGNGSTTASAVNNGSSDACGIQSMSLSQAAFTCAHVGANTVTLTVTDNNGNVSTKTATITVVDNIAPNAIAQDITVYLNSYGNVGITLAMINNGSTDACGILNMDIDKGYFTCSNVGQNTVVLSVMDNNGNISTDTAIVTVIDTIGATVITQSIIANLKSNGMVSITPNLVNNGSYDNCGIASMSVWPNNFNCSNVGNNTVTLTITDINGNVRSATAIVTVVDNMIPDVVTQNVTVYLNASGNGSTTAVAVNNGSSDNCGIASLSLSQTSFTCAHVGSNVVTLTATDVNGNVNTATATVFVVDNIAPVALCRNASVTISGGTASITASMINNGSNDACGIKSLSVSPSIFTCANIGSNAVTLTVTDNNNNTSTCNATVTVNGVVPSCIITSAKSGAIIGSATTNAVANQMFLGYGYQSMTLTCTAGGAGPFTYSWSGSFLSGSGATRTFTPTAGGSYSINCTVTNSFGCQTTCNIVICVIDVRGTTGSANNPKVRVCHVPPGNPNNPQSIEIGLSAVPAHIAGGNGHGTCRLGFCTQSCASGKTGDVITADLYNEGDVELLVYPNPSQNTFNLQLETSSDEEVSITVYDISGKLVMQQTFATPEEVIVLGEDWANGIYTAVVKQGEFSKAVKLNKTF